MKAMLIVATWLTMGGPFVSYQAVPSIQACRGLMHATGEMIREQALSNLTGPHSNLTFEATGVADEFALRTPVIQRELARLRCVSTTGGKS